MLILKERLEFVSGRVRPGRTLRRNDQCFHYFVTVHRFEGDVFSSAGFPRSDANTAFRYPESLGQETDQFLICCAIDRRCLNPYFYGVAEETDNLSPAGSGLDIERDRGHLLRLTARARCKVQGASVGNSGAAEPPCPRSAS